MSRRTPAIVGLFLVLVLSACTTRNIPLPPPYLDDLSTPQNILSNFILAYEARDMPRYRSLFSADFDYVFQEGSDEATTYPDGWTVQDDSLSTLALFRDGGVNLIRIAMVFTELDTAVWETDTTLAANSTDILLDIESGNTIRRVSGEPNQEFHLVKGRLAMGENPDFFYIRAWRELPFSPQGNELSSTPQVETVTWGGIKASYAPGSKPSS